MKSKNLFLIFSLLGTSLFLISPNDAEASPLLPSLVDENPYYFSQDNFGIDLLRVFKAPLTPYLTPGVTDKSTNEEIMNAYYKANSDLTDSFIEQDSDRAISYRLHIDSPEIYKDVTSFDFQLFNPATNPYEFSLESLASKDK